VLEVFLEPTKSLKRNGKHTKLEAVQVKHFVVKLPKLMLLIGSQRPPNKIIFGASGTQKNNID